MPTLGPIPKDFVLPGLRRIDEITFEFDGAYAGNVQGFLRAVKAQAVLEGNELGAVFNGVHVRVHPDSRLADLYALYRAKHK